MQGPPLQPTDALIRWFEQNASGNAGERRRFRLPAVVFFQNDHRAGFGKVFIGTSVTGPTDVALTLDGTALGISLWDKLRERCPKESSTCAIWLEGYWGPSMQGLPGADADPAHPFTVLTVGLAIPQPPPTGLRPSMATSWD